MYLLYQLIKSGYYRGDQILRLASKKGIANGRLIIVSSFESYTKSLFISFKYDSLWQCMFNKLKIYAR